MRNRRKPSFYYRAKCLRVIDGDTYTFRVDLGFNVWRKMDVRLRGYSVAERNTRAGDEASLTAEMALLLDPDAIVIRTHKTSTRAWSGLRDAPCVMTTGRDVRTFTRYVADVWVDGKSLVDILKEAGIPEGGA